MVRNQLSSNKTLKGWGRARSIRLPSANEELNQSTESPQLNESVSSAENFNLTQSSVSSIENLNFENNFISENDEQSYVGTPQPVSFYDNSIWNLSQALTSSTNSILSPLLQSTTETPNLNFAIEEKINSSESKVIAILGYLANFSKDFPKNNLRILKNRISFSNFYPNARAVRLPMETDNLIPMNLRDARYAQKIEQLNNK